MLPLARSLARRYANKGEPLDDLEQVACVGLFKAIDRFDLSRDVRFATYAVRRSPASQAPLPRPRLDDARPREVQELSGKIGTARERPLRLRGSPRSPTGSGDRADEDRVLEALAAAKAYRTLSLDQPFQDGTRPLEAIGDNDQGFERAEARAMLADGLYELAPRERRSSACATSRAHEREIAEHMGISQMHVSRLIRRMVKQLRERIVMPAAA